jgi:hypothetical protein
MSSGLPATCPPFSPSGAYTQTVYLGGTSGVVSYDFNFTTFSLGSSITIQAYYNETLIGTSDVYTSPSSANYRFSVNYNPTVPGVNSIKYVFLNCHNFDLGSNFTTINGTVFCPNLQPSPTPSPSRTPSVTPPITPSSTSTPSITPSRTPSVTPPVTPTSTATPSITPTRTPSITPSVTPQPTPCETPTPTPTPSPVASAATILIGTNMSLDIAMDLFNITVNGVGVTNVSGVDPNTSGNGGSVDTDQIGTYDIVLTYTADTPGQRITFYDSNSNYYCNNASTGFNSMTFYSVVINSSTNPILTAEDGTC